MKDDQQKSGKQSKTLLIILMLALVGYLIYESNAFFMSRTERLIADKVTAMGPGE